MPSSTRNTVAAATAGLVVAAGIWSTYSAHTSITELRGMAARRSAETAIRGGSPERATIVIVVPMLHEADRGLDCIQHWCKLLDEHPELRLCLVTTERERVEAPDRVHTWDVINTDPVLHGFTEQGRAQILHYPGVNRTYGEQLGWALDNLAATDVDYLYVTNADSRVTEEGCQEIIDLAAGGVRVAQQSAVFLGNLDQLSWLATGEAFFQSRWTFEVELFRYLAGSGRLRWLPEWVASRWYQHAVGHGLLLACDYYRHLGGLPRPGYGLEDAALGVAIRSEGGHIEPFATLECGDAPRNVRELQRQRSTWVRGPLCAPEYSIGAESAPFVLQGVSDGARWALGLPFRILVLAVLPARYRAIAGAGLLLGLYGPVVRVLIGLRSLDVPAEAQPDRGDVIRGLTAYPFAAVSYWLGGFRGLLRLLRDLATRTPQIQQRTQE
ncbi:hypothetical protein [Nocardia brasiliensis]|uniref:hypothetical protein n=1 Tax=Nocardia brasiliensis TaxID=37326 RepID=UPI002458AD42|nr:hypothetical protein [Nocardia brasiliensis]